MIGVQLMSNEAFSLLTGCMSVACWAMVFSPQLYDIFRRQNADNLSVSFLWLWFLGDLANITGCILQETLPTMTILAVYNTLADMVLIFQAAYYRRRRLRRIFQMYSTTNSTTTTAGQENSENLDEIEDSPNHRQETQDDDLDQADDASECEYFQSLVIPPRRVWKSAFFKFGIIFMILLASFIGLYFATDGHLYDSPLKYYNPQIPLHQLGQLFGWFCAAVYVTSRIPQIVLNYQRKSCERTSLINFLFASGGNFMFITSILVLDHSFHYLLVNSSWLCGTFFSLMLDYMIVFQSWHYDQSRIEQAVKTSAIEETDIHAQSDAKKVK
ncbi:uncharacterized protein V1516DRAFT_674847 [Lipomyces oligophaga]|uniref:uncharacterized protein n=1 Tax=Lipomyces oligophaga TaxID=45792 RepID=UPI0034CEEFBD